MSEYYRWRDICRVVGSSETCIRRMIKEGVFPPPFKLSLRNVAWEKSVVDAWLKKRTGVHKW
ncbi:AlpA family phage regulatory protein [Salmonella enterica]|nr:AlpA family phage regulatory protein [Salmonella enterica]